MPGFVKIGHFGNWNGTYACMHTYTQHDDLA